MLRLALPAAVAAAAVVAPLPAVAVDALNERIVHDVYTGLALGGYDPVAYFTEGRAVKGTARHEVVWDGGYWRFVNPGNAAAFAAAPAVYAPLFGGYCVTSLSRGALTAGDPLLFILYEERLLFFATEEDEEAFKADPSGTLERAVRRWPALSAVLAR